jgi:hypothetical protein
MGARLEHPDPAEALTMYRNTASQIVGCQMVSATDGSAFTGTVSCAVTKDGGTQGAGGGSVTHEGNGFHSYTPTQGETEAGHVAFTFTGTGAVPATVQVYPVVLNDYADAYLARDLGSGSNAGVSEERTVRSALRFLRNKWTIIAGVLTVYKENDSTASHTSALTTNAAAEAVTTSDPT